MFYITTLVMQTVEARLQDYPVAISITYFNNLDGYTIVPQSANLSSTCPLDLTLWHARCSHLNFDAVKSMHSKHLVTGMEIRSKTPPDPVCEPCILGKQRCHNIPKTATRCTSLLALVHTDLKGP